MRTIPMSEWGRDHWSMLAYVESRCVDYKGTIDFERVRCNPSRHPGLLGCRVDRNGCLDGAGAYRYPTRLAGGKIEPEHDDWDCFYDIEAAGLIEDIGTGINPIAKFTETGKALAARLRQYKAEGGQFAVFVGWER